MIPNINELISLDVYRDGGSLSVTYKDESENQHELMFYIDNIASDASKTFTIYKSASLVSYIKSEYVSPVTGIASPEFEKQERVISWSEAFDLLSKLEPLIKGLESEYKWVYGSMVIVASNKEHSVEFS